jgi:hypothetical protein
MNCRITIQYPTEEIELAHQEEAGSYNPHAYSRFFLEHMIRRRLVQLNEKNARTMDWAMTGFVDHYGISMVFKPQIFIMQDKPPLNELKASPSEELQTMDIFVISDGKRAFVKRLD